MKLLDLFCGAGGAAVGYHQAGFDEIVGVDIVPQPDYPFTFIQGDALHPPVELGGFDLIHASPPCQAYTTMAQRWGRDKARWGDLIPLTQKLFETSTTPSVLENVPGARKALGDLVIRLTGEQFGLRVHRPRLFELGDWWMLAPPRARRQPNPVAVYGHPDGRVVWRRSDAAELTAWSSIEEGQTALEVPWISNEQEIREAIPPAYTKFIGEQFLSQTETEVV